MTSFPHLLVMFYRLTKIIGVIDRTFYRHGIDMIDSQQEIVVYFETSLRSRLG